MSRFRDIFGYKHLMVAFVLLSIFGVGYYITTTMFEELNNHPEIKEIGGPPVVTDVLLVFIVTVVAAAFCTGVLWLGELQDAIEENKK